MSMRLIPFKGQCPCWHCQGVGIDAKGSAFDIPRRTTPQERRLKQLQRRHNGQRKRRK